MEGLVLCFVFLLLQGAVLGQQPQQRLSSTADLAALFSLRGSLGLRSREWPRKADPCTSWGGVGCEAGRVVGLDLSGLHRTRLGRQSPRFAVDGIQNLTRLASFNSTGFLLPGAIPDWFGSRLPASLAVLDLRRSGVTGAIPDSLGSLAGLRVLSLAGNSLSSTIPPTLGRLGNLTLLDLSSNNLSGSIPVALAALGNLDVLDLSSNFLTGDVPPVLGNLRKLKRLALSGNSLAGSIPGALGDLSSLATLDLSLNSLSGPLPGDLKNMRSLLVLDVSNNLLTGGLPDSLFSGLSQLQTLDVSHNNFSQALPDSLWMLPELRFVDISYNNFTGNLSEAIVNAVVSNAVFNLSHNFFYGVLPSGTRELIQRLRFFDLSSNYFEGELLLDISSNVSITSNCFRNATNQRSSLECTRFRADRGLDNPPDSPNTNATEPPQSSSRKNKWRLVYILVGVFGGLLLAAIASLVLFVCLRRCRTGAVPQKELNSNGVLPRLEKTPSLSPANLSAVGDSYTYAQLLQATSNFGESNLIKHGHSGDLYRGTLDNGASVVVKRIDMHTFKSDSYLAELDFFSRASHTRLVPFLGHCLENENENEKLLVYKYMPNGDLSSSLFRKTGDEEDGMKSLDWITRLKIAIGVAEALCYLHHEHVPPLVHRDIQASSILLDDKFEVRLGSLSVVCSQEGGAHQNVITRFLRSQSAEPSSSGSVSATCAYDVYCLGKVLLELVTGKLGISEWNDANTNEWLEQILPYINMYDKELLTNIIDPSLILDEDLMEEVWAMAIVAKSCFNPKPSKRPLTKYILKALENPLSVVRDEGISSSARLRATSSRGSWNAGIFGSWRSSSDIVSVSGPPREVTAFKHVGDSQGSGGEQSFSHRRQSNEIFPEPTGTSREVEV